MIVFQPVPQLGLMMFLAQRWREDVFCAFETGSRQVLDGEQKILRTRLGENGDATVSCGSHFIERFFGRKMDDINRRAGHFGHGYGPVNGFSFGGDRPGEAVINGGGLALRDRSLDDDVNDASVFGVEADQRAVFRGAGERLKDGRVVDHQHPGIGHEEFETGYALFDHVVHVFQSSFTQVRDDHVEAVVDGRFRFRFFPPGIERISHLRAFGLDGEVDQRRGAAEGCGFCAGFEIVGGRGAAEGHVEVSVDVDASGEEEHAGDVDDAVGLFDGDVWRDVFDLFADDQDVGFFGFGRGYYGAVAEEEAHLVGSWLVALRRTSPMRKSLCENSGADRSRVAALLIAMNPQGLKWSRDYQERSKLTFHTDS